jgi:hypothetical protein
MHIRLLTGPLCPWKWCPSHGSTVASIKFQTAPKTFFLTSSGSKEKGTKAGISECHQGFILAQPSAEVSSSAPHLSYKETVGHPHYLQMSSQAVMSSKQASNNPWLYPCKRQWPSLRSRTRAWDQFYIACLWLWVKWVKEAHESVHLHSHYCM